jgi:hypothetical protein
VNVHRIVVCIAALSVGLTTAVALADGYQETSPTACAVVSGARARAVLGPHALKQAEHFELPKLPAADPNLNHFLDVSHTGCAIADVTTFTAGRPIAVRVDVYERNREYSGGGEPWTPLYERLLLAKLGSKGYYLLTDNDTLAKKRKQPWLAGEDIMLLVDRKTHGERKVILGLEFDDDTWIVFSGLGGPRSALDLVSLITRGVLSR